MMTTKQFQAYKKIVEEIAANKEPLWHEAHEIIPQVYCNYCNAVKESTELELSYKEFQHEDDCIWIRSKALVEKE